MLDMKRKPAKPAKEKDRHESRFMLRLPEIYRENLQKLCGQSLRSMTTEAKLALRKHFAEHGLETPDPALDR